MEMLSQAPPERSTRKILMLPVKPRFAEAILSGQKTVELRRSRPLIEAGDLLVLYATCPSSAVAGAVQVESIMEHSLDYLWRKCRDECGVSHAEFRLYFRGKKRGVGIRVSRPMRLSEQLSLKRLREQAPAFRPPQGSVYLRQERYPDQQILDCLSMKATALAQ